MTTNIWRSVLFGNQFPYLSHVFSSLIAVDWGSCRGIFALALWCNSHNHWASLRRWASFTFGFFTITVHIKDFSYFLDFLFVCFQNFQVLSRPIFFFFSFLLNWYVSKLWSHAPNVFFMNNLFYDFAFIHTGTVTVLWRNLSSVVSRFIGLSPIMIIRDFPQCLPFSLSKGREKRQSWKCHQSSPVLSLMLCTGCFFPCFFSFRQLGWTWQLANKAAPAHSMAAKGGSTGKKEQPKFHIPASHRAGILWKAGL